MSGALGVMPAGGAVAVAGTVRDLRRAARHLGPNPAKASSKRAWTFEEDLYLVAAVCRGHSTAEVGRTLGRSYDSVDTRMRKLRAEGGVVLLPSAGERAAAMVAEARRIMAGGVVDGPDRPAKRACLKCRGTFQPDDRFNFLCGPCGLANREGGGDDGLGYALARRSA